MPVNTESSTVRTGTPDLDLLDLLRLQHALCQEALALATRENQLLTAGSDYDATAFGRQRKDLLPRLTQCLMALREWRRGCGPHERAKLLNCPEVKPVFEAVQGLFFRLLWLDRENQQALLRRGLVPAQHLAAAPVRHTHCVADLYRRHSPR